MAKPLLQNLSASNTFQNWLDRTNEVIDVFQSDALTASVLGDETGSLAVPLTATLIGSFSANNITAQTLFRVDNISPRAGSSSISVSAPVTINTSVQVVNTLNSVLGPRSNYTTGIVSWRVGFEDQFTNNFIIDSGVGTRKLSITPSGALTTAGQITAPTFSGNLTGNVTGNVTGNISGNVTGDLSGNVFGNLEGNISSTTASIGTLTVNTAATFNTSVAISGATRILTLNNNPSSGNGIRVQNNNTVSSIDFTQNMVFRNGNASTTYLTIATNGNLTASGNITAFSDSRLKKDIQPIGNAINIVKSLNGVSFKRKDMDDDRTHIGLIAQEVEKVLPEVVHTNDDGIKTVAYGNIVGLLVEAIKDLQKEVEELKKG